MEYMTTQEAAELWGVTIRRIQAMCARGNIPSAVKLSRIWVIPKGTPKPPDGRAKAVRDMKGQPMKQPLIYGTTNPAKLVSMRELLAGLPIDIIGLDQYKGKLPDIDESGNNPLENAKLKALAYYKAIGKPVFSCDSGLYIENIPDNEQPGVHIRRVAGKNLTDKEMTDYYAALARRFGGKVTAQYRNAICLVFNENNIHEYFGDDISSNSFLLTDTPHKKRATGFPLDCLSVDKESGLYYYDLETLKSDVDAPNGFRRFFCAALGLMEDLK
jgi:8-oxo-dGTP diphosphatase